MSKKNFCNLSTAEVISLTALGSFSGISLVVGFSVGFYRELIIYSRFTASYHKSGLVFSFLKLSGSYWIKKISK